MNKENQSSAVALKMQEMYDTYLNETGQYPEYADVTVRYKDDGCTIETTIKLDCGVDEDEDDEIFYYCNGLNDLKGLIEEGPGNDFTVIGIIRFY